MVDPFFRPERIKEIEGIIEKYSRKEEVTDLFVKISVYG